MDDNDIIISITDRLRAVGKDQPAFSVHFEKTDSLLQLPKGSTEKHLDAPHRMPVLRSFDGARNKRVYANQAEFSLRRQREIGVSSISSVLLPIQLEDADNTMLRAKVIRNHRT